jgi:hypothetical protein
MEGEGRNENTEGEQLSLEVDSKGKVYITDGTHEEKGWERVTTHFGASEIKPPDVNVERDSNNYVSFNKGTLVLGYCPPLNKYVKYFLQEDVNAWRVDRKKKRKMTCYCFDPEGPVEKASLYINGYEQTLSERSPIFYALRSQERKPKPAWHQKRIDS